jgi:ATP-binding cassette subfamily B (MDR/TAP) protein 1
LDATSRILVFEALKRWRKNKTTIVITHDLSQITAQDFVYVLKKGRVVEQGYRSDLEAVSLSSPSDDYIHYDTETQDAPGKGEFRKMMESQRLTGGFLPEKDLLSDSEDRLEELQEALEEVEEELEDEKKKQRSAKRDTMKHQSILRPLTLGNWMFDVVAELVSPPAPAALLRQPTTFGANESRPVTRFAAPMDYRDPLLEAQQRQRRPSSVIVESPTSPSKRPLSLQFTPVTPTSTSFTLPMNHIRPSAAEEEEEDEEFEQEKEAVKKSGGVARDGRSRRERRAVVTVAVDEKQSRRAHPTQESSQGNEEKDGEQEEEEEKRPPFWAINRTVFPNVPNKPLLILGLFVCLCSGAMTPVFSFLLSRLLFEVSIGAQNVAVINKFGAIVLCIAAADGFLLGAKFFIMEYSGVAWVTRLRSKAFGNLLKQDTKFFDKRPQHGAAKLVQVVVKDAEDARNLIATVWGQCLVVSTMLSVGLIWAMARGWQLTLVGLAVAPVFAGVMSLQTALVAKCELRNKRAREDVAKGYYEAIINVRGIRAMAFEKLFWNDFDKATNRALTTGVRGAFVEGCTYGVASGLIYLAEALLFYVGAVLIAKGTYTYLQMVEVLNLVVFSVTIGSQLMAFSTFFLLIFSEFFY